MRKGEQQRSVTPPIRRSPARPDNSAWPGFRPVRSEKNPFRTPVPAFGKRPGAQNYSPVSGSYVIPGRGPLTVACFLLYVP